MKQMNSTRRPISIYHNFKPKEAAQLLNIDEDRLRDLRNSGRGPFYVRTSRGGILYPSFALAEFLASYLRLDDPTTPSSLLHAQARRNKCVTHVTLDNDFSA